ncbi:MAG: MBL fold metallo-hydrolase [Bacteroidales bacterium]|nr:MBL fold metallo-hydrolase [Candidatus Cacconaster merdequi]
MVRFASLSSGSSGNCYYLSDGNVAFLIDAGIGGRTIKKRLSDLDIDFNSIGFILVTHDHVDHIKSLGLVTERFAKPVYTTRTLHSALSRHFCTRGKMAGCVKVLEEGRPNEVCGIQVTPFEVPHDATQTVGYHIILGGESITVMTDLGSPTDEAVHYASIARHLVVEANYDVDMLVSGPYPQALKRRIMSDCGHLSNEQTCSLICRAANEDLKNIFLCHLSAHNNTPASAYNTVKETLGKIHSQASLYCLPRTQPSELFFLG